MGCEGVSYDDKCGGASQFGLTEPENKQKAYKNACVWAASLFRV